MSLQIPGPRREEPSPGQRVEQAQRASVSRSVPMTCLSASNARPKPAQSPARNAESAILSHFLASSSEAVGTVGGKGALAPRRLSHASASVRPAPPTGRPLCATLTHTRASAFPRGAYQVRYAPSPATGSSHTVSGPRTRLSLRGAPVDRTESARLWNEGNRRQVASRARGAGKLLTDPSRTRSSAGRRPRAAPASAALTRPPEGRS